MKKPVGYLINEKSGLRGERGEYYDYVVAGNGVFIEVEGDLMAARIPISKASIRGLVELTPKFVLRHGPIPIDLLYQAVNKMRLEPTTELYAAVIWVDPDYRVRFPAQLGDQAHVNYAVPDGRIILDLHSHGSMEAFFSPKDDADEQALRIYGVVGNLPGAPCLKLRVGVYGYFMAVDTGVFDADHSFSEEEIVDEEIPGLVKVLKFWRW